MASQMEYTNCLKMEQIDYLDLFDDIPYKYIKNIIKDEYYELEVEITDLECDRVAWCKTKFEFELEINISQGSLPLYNNKKFSKVIEYNTSSPMMLFMLDLQIKDEEESSEEEDEEKVQMCWTCDEKEATHKVFRDALGEYEHTCDKCFKEEYEEEDAHQCELCNKYVEETEYLPSKEDEEKQQILGNDYCLECYKKVENFEFVENIDLDKHE